MDFVSTSEAMKVLVTYTVRVLDMDDDDDDDYPFEFDAIPSAIAADLIIDNDQDVQLAGPTQEAKNHETVKNWSFLSNGSGAT